jgi:hypothetical protein
LLPKLAQDVAAAKAREVYAEKRAQQLADGTITEAEYYAEFEGIADDDEGSETDVKMEVDDSAGHGAEKGKGKAGSPIEIEDQTAEVEAAGGGEETPVASPKRPTRAKAKPKVAAPIVKKERVADKMPDPPQAVRVRLLNRYRIV